MPDVPTADEIAAIGDPRDRFLAAGARMLVDDGFRVLAAGLSPERVAALAGRSRRTFYEHFETKEDYLRAVLARHLDTSDEEMESERLTEDVLALLVTEEGLTMLDTIEALAHSLYASNAASEDTRLQTIAWAVAGTDGPTTVRHREYLHVVEDTWRRNVELAAETWGLSFRPPWTPQLFGQALLSLFQGYYVRHKVGGRDHADDFSLALTTLIASAMHRIDEPPEQLQDRLASLRRAAAIGVRERQDPAAAITARRRLLDALEAALDEHSLAHLSLADVADRAGVGLGTVRASFGGLDALLAELIADRLPPFSREIEFDRRTTDLGFGALLRRHVARMSSWTNAHPRLALAIVNAATEPSDGGEQLLASVVESTVELLSHAQAEGTFVTPVPIQPVATMLTFAVLGTTLVPGTPDDVDWLVELVERAVTAPGGPA